MRDLAMMMNHIAALTTVIRVIMVIVPSILLSLLIEIIVLFSFTPLVSLAKVELIRIMCH